MLKRIFGTLGYRGIVHLQFLATDFVFSQQRVSKEQGIVGIDGTGNAPLHQFGKGMFFQGWDDLEQIIGGWTNVQTHLFGLEQFRCCFVSIRQYPVSQPLCLENGNGIDDALGTLAFKGRDLARMWNRLDFLLVTTGNIKSGLKWFRWKA